MPRSDAKRRAAGARARGLGAELARLRRRVDLTTRQVADRTDLSASTISRTETGLRKVTSEEVAALLLYKITGAQTDRLIGLARDIGRPGWFETGSSGLPSQLVALAAFESQATHLTDVSPILVPGLLRTADYARAMMVGAGVPDREIERMVAARASRQVILSRPVPPKLHAILDEVVLRRLIGGRAVMAEQLRHLTRMATRPNIAIQVMRCAAHPGVAGAYFVLEFPPPATPFVHLMVDRCSTLETRTISGPSSPAPLSPTWVSR